MKLFVALLLVFCFGTACAPVVASLASKIPIENVQNCKSLCQSVQMKLGALVIVANYTGCVCEPSEGQASKEGSTASISGGAVIEIVRQQQAAQSQQQHQHQHQHH